MVPGFIAQQPKNLKDLAILFQSFLQTLSDQFDTGLIISSSYSWGHYFGEVLGMAGVGRRIQIFHMSDKIWITMAVGRKVLLLF